MRIAQDARFRAERERFQLRFCCEDCAMFASDRGVCSLGYPEGDHRAARYDAPEADVVFCKDWQLV